MVNKSAAWRAASASLVVAGCLSVYSACAAALATPNMWDTQERINRYIESGQYDTDVAAVVAQARAYMEQRAPAVSKPAIVLDIDETALTNWPAYRANGWARITGGPCDVERGPCGTLAWQQMAAAKAIAPTLELAKRAEALNVAVFFITGRMENLREATDRNLRQAGYRPAGLILEPDNARFASAADFKAPERRKLIDQGYTVLLSMGDQQSDLDGGYTEKTFKLPNPVYFLP